MNWLSNGMIALYIAVGAVGAGVLGWAVLGKTVRTRLRMERILAKDSDINDWLIVFNWTPKILYLPTVAVSVLACLFMYLKAVGGPFEGIGAETVGGGCGLRVPVHAGSRFCG